MAKTIIDKDKTLGMAAAFSIYSGDIPSMLGMAAAFSIFSGDILSSMAFDAIAEMKKSHLYVREVKHAVNKLEKERVRYESVSHMHVVNIDAFYDDADEIYDNLKNHIVRLKSTMKTCMKGDMKTLEPFAASLFSAAFVGEFIVRLHEAFIERLKEIGAECPKFMSTPTGIFAELHNVVRALPAFYRESLVTLGYQPPIEQAVVELIYKFVLDEDRVC